MIGFCVREGWKLFHEWLVQWSKVVVIVAGTAWQGREGQAGLGEDHHNMERRWNPHSLVLH